MRFADPACSAMRVCDVTVASSRPTLLSQITRLRLTYDGAAADAPATVILKTGLPERTGDGWNAGRQEVAFYTQVASAMPARLAPRCFDAHWDADTNAWHLLLEDLTDTHVIATTWPLPPTMEQCESILRARARFHAGMVGRSPSRHEVGTWLEPRPWIGNCKVSPKISRASSIAWVTACRASGAISTSDCSMRRPA